MALAALAAPRLPAELRRPQTTLRHALRRLSPNKRARVALALAHELAALHADGTSVGQLSPDTVSFGMTGYPRIVQIGEADRDSPYTAPELLDRATQLRRPHGTPRADTYAFGALMYFMFTGRQPPSEWTTREFAQLSPTTASLIARCVATDPWVRPDVAEVTRIIERVGPERLQSQRISNPIDLIRRKPAQAWNVASMLALTSTAAVLVLAGTVTTVVGAVGVAAMLVGASISVGASF